MFENIERIKTPSPQVLLDEYLRKQRPVIITDLFEGQPISKISSLAEGREQLGQMPVLIREGYDEYFRRALQTAMSGSSLSENPQEERSTVEGYLSLVEQEPNTLRTCSDVPSAMLGDVQRLYSIPKHCLDEKGAPEDFQTVLWMANAGNFTHLHFDNDFRNLLQYQVWGEKRVFLIPPPPTAKLVPLGNLAVVSPRGMAPAEYDRFIQYVDGYQALLRTGETLFVPALMWHYFEYRDTSMALSMRFRRNSYLRFLCDNLHTDFRLQAISWKFVDENAVDARSLKAFAQLRAAHAQPVEDPFEKGALIQDVINQVHEELCLDRVAGEMTGPFLEDLRSLWRNTEITARHLYDSSRPAIGSDGQPAALSNEHRTSWSQ